MQAETQSKTHIVQPVCATHVCRQMLRGVQRELPTQASHVQLVIVQALREISGTGIPQQDDS